MSFFHQDFATKPLIALAPMDGITNRSFRKVVRRVAKDIVLYSEFTKVGNIPRELYGRLGFSQEELPYIVQLIGNDPEEFRTSIPKLADLGITAIDLNMGCPARKIASSKHGSSLMLEPDLACRIIEACKSACDLPITIKTRLGWQDPTKLISFAQRMESAGLDAITIHGRTYTQKFEGTADWSYIYELKRNIGIPVFGNGDVTNLEDGLKKRRNLDGFMIGRAALGNPWVFLSSVDNAMIETEERINLLEFHLDCLSLEKPGRENEIRKFLPGYLKGLSKEKLSELQKIPPLKIISKVRSILNEKNSDDLAA